MRIAHVSDCYLPRLGGIELQVHDLAAGQVAQGHEVAIFTTTGEGPVAPEDRAGTAVVRARPGGAVEKIRYRQTRATLRSFMAELDRFDAVHVHASSFSPLSFLAAHHASRRGVPTVATVHSLWAKATCLFRSADRLTGWAEWPVVWSAVSNAAASPLRSILDDRAEVNILPNGIDPAEWRIDPRPGRPGELRITAVSRLARRKRALRLVEMMAAVSEMLPTGYRLQVEILGDGPERGKIERFLRRHGMDSWVHLRGRRTRLEIRGVFSRSDLFVAPSSLESFGIAALEARCAGLPIVALAGTGVQDFVSHGREGWLVDTDRAMVETIASLARSPEILQRVAAHNRSVPAAITWPGVLAGCEHLYVEAAHKHGRTWTGPAPALDRMPGPSVRLIPPVGRGESRVVS